MDSPAVPENRMLQKATLTILGSGGGEASANRVSSGYLLETPQTAILFDCGDGVTGSFIRAGKNYDDVDAILISHTHPDHICGLPFFLQQLYLAQRQRELVIHLPGEALAAFKSFLVSNYLFVERFGFPVKFASIHDKQGITLSDLVITPHLNTHLTAHRGQPWMAGFNNKGECFSFKINHNSRKVVYSADIGSLDDLGFCEGCELLLVESTHIRLPELYARAAAWNIDRLILTHICPGFDPHAAMAAAKRFSGEVIIAEDGLVIPLAD
jgi:ribonuclease BN (tRNA processing enzyme)